jgi:hypothetical protein
MATLGESWHDSGKGFTRQGHHGGKSVFLIFLGDAQMLDQSSVSSIRSPLVYRIIGRITMTVGLLFAPRNNVTGMSKFQCRVRATSQEKELERLT